MSFVVVLNGSLFKLFLDGIGAVAEQAVVSFGPEKIVCNAFSSTGEILYSGAMLPIKTTLGDIVELELPISKMVEQFDSETKPLPDEMVCQYANNVFDCYPNVQEVDVVDEIIISSVEVISTTRALALPAKVQYPVKLSIDTETLDLALIKLKKTEYTIFSFEEGKLFIATSDWSDRVEIPSDKFFLDTPVKGSFSSMHRTDLILGVHTILSVFASIKIGIGEDIPLIMLGYSQELKLGFMISQLLENK